MCERERKEGGRRGGYVLSRCFCMFVCEQVDGMTRLNVMKIIH